MAFVRNDNPQRACVIAAGLRLKKSREKPLQTRIKNEWKRRIFNLITLWQRHRVNGFITCD